ncbi:MAG TPA: flagellar hook-associated protein FlgL [Thermoanaerobacterales bacterium]|nr:flagellar hook-associated protein FlgL [Thermoanaerobacterales bacterium]
MRVTNKMMTDNFLKNLQTNLKRLDKVNNQLYTGKMIRFPSDDPLKAASSLKFRTELVKVNQYKKNIDDGLALLQTTESALTNIGDILQRIRELSVNASTDVMTVEDKKKLKAEVTQLKQQLVHEANSTYSGRYIFAGYKTDKPPYEIDSATNAVIYKGDNSKIEYEVGPFNTICINFTGPEVFNSPHDLFQVLESFEDALDAGDTEAIGGIILKNINDSLENVITVRADLGALVNRIEMAKNRLEDDMINLKGILSETEDVDIAEAIMELKMQENVYMTSLAAGARIIQPSLLDFLR